MKLVSWLALGLAMLLGGCKKEATPTPNVDAPFNQRFLLRYERSAALPAQSAPELTVTIDDVVDTRCPQNITCLSPGDVRAVVGVKNQAGERQTATLCLGCDPSTKLSDSAVVQTNNRRYVLLLSDVTPVPTALNQPKKDKQVQLTVKR